MEKDQTRNQTGEQTGSQTASQTGNQTAGQTGNKAGDWTTSKSWSQVRNNSGEQTKYLALAAMIAALYVVLTFVANAFGLASGEIQVRISEGLSLLPCLLPAVVPGLTIGCLLANILTGCVPLDIVFGTLATLIGAVGTRMMRKQPYLSWIPPVLSNTLIVPIVLMKAYGVETAWPLLSFQIFAGEMISCCGIGILLYRAVKPLVEKKLIG